MSDPAQMDEKYDQYEELGTGGYGSVFAGIRRLDDLPVSIL